MEKNYSSTMMIHEPQDQFYLLFIHRQFLFLFQSISPNLKSVFTVQICLVNFSLNFLY